MALLGPLDPRQQQAEQQRTRTTQALQAEAELTKLLREHGQNKDNQPFTSPWQVAGQWANALAGRAKQNDLNQGQLALNSLAAPGGQDSPAAATQPSQVPAAAAAPASTGQVGAKAAPFAPEIKQAIIEGSQAAGVDPHMMAVFAHIESGGRAGPEADTGHYKGLMQLSEAEMHQMSGGQGNVYNPKDSVMAAGLIAKRNQEAFERFTGRKPNEFDTYMMHQQGPAGYFQHIGNPNAPAWQNMAATGEGKAKGQHWAQAAITGNGGKLSDTSQQFLQRWSDKWQRMQGGDHSAFTSEQPQATPAGGQPGAAPSPGAAPVQGGAPGGGASPTGMVEQGQFLPPGSVKQLQPTYTLERLQQLARSGMLKPEEIARFHAEIQQSQQPQEVPFGGGTVRIDPRNPSQQTYIPKIENKPVKIGDIETQQPYWIDSKGQMRRMGEPQQAPVAPAAAQPGPQSEASPAGSGRPPFPAGGSMTDLANYGEDRKVRIAGEEEDIKTQVSNRNKMFNAIYGGITGNAMNAANQAPNLQLLKEATPLAFTGAGADALLGLNRLAARLGIDTKGAAPRELFNTLSARILSDQFAAMRNLAKEEGTDAARVFKSMLDIEEKANLTHVDSLEGAMAKINLIEQTGKQAMRWGDLADDHVAKHGSLDPTFMKKLRKDIAETKFEDIVPEKGKAPADTSITPAKRLRYDPKTGRIE